MRPLHSKVVIRRLGAETKSPGGIIIPDAAKEKPQRGEVLAVGPGKLLVGPLGAEHAPMQVKPGDVVLFAKYTGMDDMIDGQAVTIVDEDQILLVLASKGPAEVTQ